MDLISDKCKTETAVIGPSISIVGDIAGSQDILVQGTVKGTISLGDNVVTVGTGARVEADIVGRVIHVEGEVKGNLTGMEQVVVHKSGRILGNITAPRLSLEDGARLKGSIDTDAHGDNKSFDMGDKGIKNAPSFKEIGTSSSATSAITPKNGHAAKVEVATL